MLAQLRAGFRLTASILAVAWLRATRKAPTGTAAGPQTPFWVEALRRFLRAGIVAGAKKSLAAARKDIPATYVPLPIVRRMTHQKAFRLGCCNAEVFTAKLWAPGGPTILYLHGGGYVACSPASHRALCAYIADAAKARLYALDYRLAPEHPFPAAVDDAYRAYQALVGELHTSPRAIVLAGDSSGGGLALATMLRARNDGLALPAGAALLSPWLDLACTRPSIVANEDRCYLVRDALGTYRAHYMQQHDVAQPLASPIGAELAGLPTLLLQIGAGDMLHDEAVEFAARARAAGIATTLDIEPHMFHAYQTLTPLLAQARAAARRVGIFAADCVASAAALSESAPAACDGASSGVAGAPTLASSRCSATAS